MKQNLELAKPTQLEEIVKNSGLEIQEGEQIKKSYLPFLEQLSEVQQQSAKINFSAPGKLDEDIARALRLKTVKIRTGASDLKDDRKRIYLLKGNLEQAAYNLIAASCKLIEEEFYRVEKAREIALQLSGIGGRRSIGFGLNKKIPAGKKITAQVLNACRRGEEALVIFLDIPGQVRADGA